MESTNGGRNAGGQPRFQQAAVRMLLDPTIAGRKASVKWIQYLAFRVSLP
jgi:hypothetical protein